ncbi:MAG: hypothetical protein KAJ23_01405, partial [Maribacter sp.]|nr:hypothetical protein [Maribacter sp.]
MKNITFLMLLTVFLLQSCSSDNDPAPKIDDDPIQMDDPEPENSVRLADDVALGKILTDSEGMSLYFFSLDTKDNSECFDGCLNAWP